MSYTVLLLADVYVVFLLIFACDRGAVKIWKPKVTPMSELAPVEIKLIPDSVTDNDRYVQKTSLAADKVVRFHLCFHGFTRDVFSFFVMVIF